jgi:hypothetical protein
MPCHLTNHPPSSSGLPYPYQRISTSPMLLLKSRALSRVGAIFLALVVLIAVGGTAGYLGLRTYPATTTTPSTAFSSTSSSRTSTSYTCTTTRMITNCCQPFNGACVGNWSATFSVVINYSGQWSASYSGFTTLQTVRGNYSGGGSNSTTIILKAWGVSESNLCVTASKQDSSNATLVLSLGALSPEWTNSTSLPYGSTRACGAVAI